MTNKALAVGILALLFWPRKAKAAPQLATVHHNSADAYFEERPPVYYPNQDPGLPLVPPTAPPPEVAVQDPQVSIYFPPAPNPPTPPGPAYGPIYADRSIYDGYTNTPPPGVGPGIGPFPQPPQPPVVPTDDNIVDDNRVLMTGGRSERFRYVWLEGFSGLMVIVIYDADRHNYFAYVPAGNFFAPIVLVAGKLNYFKSGPVPTGIRMQHDADALKWFERYSFWYTPSPGLPYATYNDYKQSLKFWQKDFSQAPWPLDSLTAVADRYQPYSNRA